MVRLFWRLRLENCTNVWATNGEKIENINKNWLRNEESEALFISIQAGWDSSSSTEITKNRSHGRTTKKVFAKPVQNIILVNSNARCWSEKRKVNLFPWFSSIKSKNFHFFLLHLKLYKGVSVDTSLSLSLALHGRSVSPNIPSFHGSISFHFKVNHENIFCILDAIQ